MITPRGTHPPVTSPGRDSRRKTIAFFPAHPSQLWMQLPVAEAVSRFADVVWVLRDKDCLIDLAKAKGIDYLRISNAGRGLIGNGFELAANFFRCMRLTRRLGIDLWVTKLGSGNAAARLAGIPSLSFNDDDADVVPLIAWTSYPLADMTLVTDCTRMGRFEHRAVRYAGNHELFYLHPNRFSPDAAMLGRLGIGGEQPFAIVRLSSLEAHHDRGIRGVSRELLRRVIKLTAGRIRLFITSEKPLAEEFEPLRLPIPPEHILHALAGAEFFLGDSQTMTSEAAVLGTPALRINDFVGRLSYLDELEQYGLAFGFKPGDETSLVAQLEQLLAQNDRREVFAARRRQFLADKIDPVPWYTEVIRMAAGGATREQVQAWARKQRAASHSNGSTTVRNVSPNTQPIKTNAGCL